MCRHPYIPRLGGPSRENIDIAETIMDIQYTLNFLRAVSEAVSQAGRTVISALHDLNLAATFSNRMVHEIGQDRI
ncbi:MAG: hypothetical protein U9Q89_02710 [Thermodesulfobacteriota bacterium]|nr:hypothetical protein [Thermodesulfobacteriota bacterium]